MTHRPGHSATTSVTAERYDELYPAPRPEFPGDPGPTAEEGEEDSLPRARNLSTVGITPRGVTVFLNEDPQSVDSTGRPIPLGYIVQQRDGTFAPAGPALVAAAQGRTPTSDGGGSSVPFSFERIPGVGLVAQDKRTGQVRLVLPEPQVAPDLRLEVDPRTGNLLTINPATGQVRDTGQRIGFPQVSPQEQRAQELADRQAQQQFALAQQQASQQFTGRESALDRAQRAAEFATQTQLAQIEEARARRQQQLAAANQFAQLVSLTDPLALPAFLEAGGGVISNAIAAGANALSDRALLPAAQTLRLAEQLRAQQAAFQQPLPGGTFVGGQEGYTPEEAALIQQRINAQFAEQVGQAALGNPNTIAFNPQDETVLRAAGVTPYPGLAASFGAGGNAVTGSSTGGGFSLAPTAGGIGANTGFTQATRAGTPGFDLYGNPVVSAAEGFAGTVTQPTTFVAGENGPETVFISPQDQPYVNRVRALRQGVRMPSFSFLPGGRFNTGFRFLPPTAQQVMLQAESTRTGVPLQDLFAEAQRFAVQGVDRGSFSFGR